MIQVQLDEDTLAATLVSCDADCDACGRSLAGQLAISTRSLPYDYNSAVISCLPCFDATGYATV